MLFHNHHNVDLSTLLLLIGELSCLHCVCSSVIDLRSDRFRVDDYSDCTTRTNIWIESTTGRPRREDYNNGSIRQKNH